MSALVFQYTEAASSLSPLRVTVKVMALPSAAEASATEKDGTSSSVTVTATSGAVTLP